MMAEIVGAGRVRRAWIDRPTLEVNQPSISSGRMPVADVMIPQGTTVHRVEQLTRPVVVDQGDGKDLVVRESAAQVQVVAGGAQQVKPVGKN